MHRIILFSFTFEYKYWLSYAEMREKRDKGANQWQKKQKYLKMVILNIIYWNLKGQRQVYFKCREICFDMVLINVSCVALFYISATFCTMFIRKGIIIIIEIIIK